MLKINTYSSKGSKLADFSLPKEFGVSANLNLLAQSVRVYEEGSHIGLRKTKTRAEVNRTTKKVYKQKGTGNARHGSKRAPIYVGGGIAHGPRPLRRILMLPSKMRGRAKMMAISFKVQRKEVVLVEGIEKLKKTSEVFDLVSKFSKALGGKRFTFALAQQNRAFRNLKNVEIFLFKNINVFQILKSGILVIDKEIFGKKK